MIPRKVLGIYGGMGPAATAEFLRLLAALAPASYDQEHPKIFVYSNPQTPDRSSALVDGGASPEAALHEGLDRLCDWGADLLAVPCNTAHCFIDRFRPALRRPLIHIVEATVAAARLVSPEGCWLVATGGTLTSGIYEREGERQGVTFFRPEPSETAAFGRVIGMVKAGRLAEAGQAMKVDCETLLIRRDLPVVCACTELPLAWNASALPPEQGLSSLECLTRACLSELYAAGAPR